MLIAQKTREVDFQHEVEYVLELCNTYNFSIIIINAVGHGYQYGSTRYEK